MWIAFDVPHCRCFEYSYIHHIFSSKITYRYIYYFFPYQVEEESGEELHEEGQDGGQDEADSTDGVVLVNGNEPDEEWGTNTEGNPSA